MDFRSCRRLFLAMVNIINKVLVLVSLVLMFSLQKRDSTSNFVDNNFVYTQKSRRRQKDCEKNAKIQLRLCLVF